MEGDNLKESQQYLNALIQNLKNFGLTTYLKAPASYFCRDADGSPYILGVESANNLIIEMYGEEVHQYKTSYQIFSAEESQDKSK